MTDSQIRFEELITALKQRDFRLTPQRVELVRLIATSDEHPDAAQLFDRVRRQFPTMSHATVYKTLALLKDMGQVLEIDLHGDSHYDGRRPQPHPHLICLNCGKIIDAEVSLDQRSIQELEKVSGYLISRSQVSIYGLCPNCRNGS
jgi:Fur family peroxide stress response transcriptional regulator